MIYKTIGVCSNAIEFQIEDNVVKNVEFRGGCQGNTTGVASLVKGMQVDEVIERLSGIQCGFRGTSCPDQLSKALKEFKETR